MRPRDIGTRAETDVVRWLARHGFPHAERMALRGSGDVGDIRLCPGVIAEVKAGEQAKRASWGDLERWAAETETERWNAHAAVGLLVVKRTNRSNPGPSGWQAVLPLWALTYLAVGPAICPPPSVFGGLWTARLSDAARLLRAAGYGDPLPLEGP